MKIVFPLLRITATVASGSMTASFCVGNVLTPEIFKQRFKAQMLFYNQLSKFHCHMCINNKDVEGDLAVAQVRELQFRPVIETSDHDIRINLTVAGIMSEHKILLKLQPPLYKFVYPVIIS